MAVGGTVSKPIWYQDGMYMTFTADEAITLGQLVEVTTADHVAVGTVADGTNNIIGVAVQARRYSRTQTDNSVAAGEKVVVATRGVCYIYTGTSAILVGSLVEAGAAGIVQLAGTAGTAGNIKDSIGMALDANGSAAATIRVKLMRG